MTLLQAQRLGLLPPLLMQQILYAAEGGAMPEIAALAPRFAAPGGEPSDVIAACRRYVELLEALVHACERAGP